MKTTKFLFNVLLFTSIGAFGTANANGISGPVAPTGGWTNPSGEVYNTTPTDEIGIGTSGNASKLHVEDSETQNTGSHFVFDCTNASGSSNSAHLFTLDHGRGTGFTGGLLNVTNSNSTKTQFFVKGNGHVGIGNGSPSTNLDIQTGPVNGGIHIDNTSGLLGYDPLLAFQISGTTKFTMGVDNSDGDKFKLGTTAITSTTILTLESDGDVVFNEDSGIQDFRIESNTSTHAFIVNSNPTGSDEIVINEDGVSTMKFRVESDTEDALFYCDGTENAIGIGTSNTADLNNGYILNVNGKIRCEELKVYLQSNWADYVFEDKYELKPLEEVESFIQENHHLPEMPKAAELEENGMHVSDMLTLQMKKIEELTLYIIDQEKRIEKLEQQLSK